jgi:hypothetical protein
MDGRGGLKGIQKEFSHENSVKRECGYDKSTPMPEAHGSRLFFIKGTIVHFVYFEKFVKK